MMGRRGFLRAGGTTGLFAAATSSCAPASLLSVAVPSTAPLDLSDAEMESFLHDFDRGLAQIGRGGFLQGMVPEGAKLSPATRAGIERGDALARKAMRTLYIAGMHAELSDHNRGHAGLQARLEQSMPEMDEAILGMTGMLSAMSESDRAALRRQLELQPDLGVRIAEGFSEPEQRVDAPWNRRLQLRATLTNLAWRLRVQSPSLLIDEYVAKVQKVARRQGQAEELQRHIAAAAAQRAIFGLAAGQGASGAMPAASSGGSNDWWTPPATSANPTSKSSKAATSRSRPALEPEPKSAESKTSPLVRTGGVIMGIGAAAGLAGGLMLAVGGTPGVATAGLIIIAIGLIALVAGLVTLLVGLAR